MPYCASSAHGPSSATAAAAVPSVMSVLQPHSTSLRTLSASDSSSSSSSVYDINLAGSDCRFFFEQSCNKGTQCVYRHCAAARHMTQVWHAI